MKTGLKWSILVFCTILQYIGFLLFAKGFFPQKILLQGVNTFEKVHEKSDILRNIYLDKNSQIEDGGQKKSFDKLIFVVIDALRSDFVFSTNSSMSDLHMLLNKNAAIGFTGFSSPPTVTLPRLKGITTGSSSNFLDAILNINEDDTSSSSNLGNQDSWVQQFKLHKSISKESKINFFGDDTWLKLFPDFFDEIDGTSSFFVSDFTEVDNNVTRHIEPQLANDDWDGLILHYLGLDHIGHKSGPNSVFMPGKQKELDNIISKIYSDYMLPKFENENQNTLMVILGDHGMNEIGNHGGSSTSETSSALVFVSPSFKNISNQETAPMKVNDDYSYLENVNQIDLVPTLCYFFDLPIPKNNLGVVLKKFGPVMGSNAFMYKLLENAYQFKVLIETKFGKPLAHEYVDTEKENINNDHEFNLINSLYIHSVLKYEKLYKEHKLKTMTNEELEMLIEKFYLFLNQTQEYLQNTSTNYDVPLLSYSLVIVCAVLMVMLALFLHSFHSLSVEAVTFYLVLSFMMGFSVFASSMIEEEHQLWWFFSLVYVIFVTIIYLSYKISLFRASLLCLGCLILLRLMRFWNPSGQKYNFLEEFITLKLSYYLNENINLSLYLFCITLILYIHRITLGGLNLLYQSVAFIIPALLYLLCVTFKINFEFTNTGGKNFDMIFTWIVEKTLPTDDGDIKTFLIDLAQLTFKILFSCIFIRILLCKFRLYWLNEVIESESQVLDENLDEDPEKASIKSQLMKMQGKNSKIKPPLKTEVKRVFIDGKYKLIDDVANLMTVFLLLQSKVENSGLYLVFFGIRKIITHYINDIIDKEFDNCKDAAVFIYKLEKRSQMEQDAGTRLFLIYEKKTHLKVAFFGTIATLILQNLSFFQFAFTNSLSTVDLTNAYNGVKSYDLIVVGLLTFVSNFAPTIYWSFNSLLWLYNNKLINFDSGLFPKTSFVKHLFSSTSIRWEIFYVRFFIMILFYTIVGLFLIIACFNLRYHLFIWTVFSPKLLFFFVWNILITGLIELVIALFITLF